MSGMPRRIPMSKPQIGSVELEAVARVLRSGMLSQGSEVAAFEAEFSELVQGRPCVAVNSGTSALHLGLLACSVGSGQEVIVPSFTFAGTANAVALTGATPVFADVDPQTYCLSPEGVEAAITPRTVGIMPVHLFGHPADMGGLGGLASRYGLAIFEDACQAHGASLRDRPVGTFGTFAAFSFYPTKNMTTGEGGLVVCADEQVARRVRLLRNQGMEHRYANEIVGYNNRMTDIAAAIGRVQLRRLQEFTNQRRANAARYDARLHGVRTPFTAPGSHHVYHQYTIRTDKRRELSEALERSGIGHDVYYPTPVHQLPAFDRRLHLPATERLTRQVLSLPVHPGLNEEDLDAAIEAVNAVAAPVGVIS